MKNKLFTALTAMCVMASCTSPKETPIDREALVHRNNPQITAIDSLASLSVGNGEFAFTVDATGLQTFPNTYKMGVPLGTQSQWGWHSFDNPKNLKPEEALKEYDFGRGHKELYATQFKEDGRAKDASNWYRVNPHRLHLGIVGFELGDNVTPQQITDIKQELDMWKGEINSHFKFNGNDFNVKTVCHPSIDMIAAEIESKAHAGICFRFPYPTGGHCDDACNWDANDKHSTTIVSQDKQSAVLKHQLDATTYYVTVRWEGNAELKEKQKNYFVLTPQDDKFAFTCTFTPENNATNAATVAETQKASAEYWKAFWTNGAAVDFSECTDPRAKELERRVVLSQYLLAIQCAGSTPPQETGLTYNSWYGKFHLEMIWWHQAQFALWNRAELLDRTLGWYESVEPVAREIAKRQGFDGVRWMKMTDPSGTEAPSKVGSFLIWQQPHLIYLAELLYRNNPDDKKILEKYGDLVQKTAEFMYSFASYDTLNGRYILKGAIPAQETLRAAETVNPPFELSYWHYAMQVAQDWRERRSMQRNLQWDEMIDKLSPLAYNEDKLYLAAETATDTYKDIRFTSDHMAVLGAVGILPMNKLIREEYMKNTLNWIWDNWNWGKTWGWDYPMTAMNAARMGEPEKAVGALLMDKRTNTYLVNGHNYQDGRLRLYLPGNGGLLTAVAMMCAGWDGCTEKNPGFPKDGTWNVKWEGLKPMP